MTTQEAYKALRWGLCQQGLDHWDVSLVYSDDRPTWASANAELDGGGQSLIFCNLRKAYIWVGPAGCLADNGNDPLAVLFHEILHITLEAAGVTDDSEPLDFHIDRTAETMAFAYRGGMKPWR